MRPATCPCPPLCSAPTLTLATAATTQATATVALAVNGDPPSSAFTGILVAACTGGATTGCPSATCSTEAQLAACTVSGLTPGTGYSLTAALVDAAGAAVSETSSPQPVTTTLHT